MTARSVAVRLSAEVAGYVAGMRQAGAETRKAMTEASKHVRDHSAAIDQLGGTAGKIGLAAAAGLGAVVGATARFDKQMSAVKATGEDAAGSFEQLREAAVDAGAQTAFSATEAAAGIENLAKAGVDAQDILGGGLSGALDLAAAGEMQVADAAEAAAGAMAQFKLEGADVPHIADLLAAGAGKAQGDVSDMVLALKQAGTVSAQTGLSLEETVGSLAAMAEQSLLGSDAGTSFKTMLAALTPNSEKAASAMEQYNIHAFDAQGNFVGMTELAGQLQAGLGDLTDEQRAMALETIFGSDAVRAASIVYDNGADGIAKWTSEVNDAGYAAEVAGTKMDNLAGDWEELTGSLETALIGSGEGSTGILRDMTQSATGLVNAFNDLPDSAKNTATGLAAVTAVTGGGLWFTGKVITGIGDTRQALRDLAPEGTRSARALKAVGSAAAGLTALATVGTIIDSLRGEFEDSLPGVEEFTQNLLTMKTVADLGPEMEGLAAGLEHSESGMGTFEAKVGGVISGLGGLGTGLAYAGDALTGNFNSGLVATMDTAEQLDAQIGLVDTAFANLVRSGSTETAAQAFEDFATAQNLSSEARDQLLDRMPQYRDAIAGVENETTLAADASGEAADGMTEIGDAAEDGVENVDEFTDSLKALREELDQRADVRNFEAAIDEAAAFFAERAALMDEIAAARADVAGADTKAERRSAEERLADLQEKLKGLAVTLDITTEAGRKNEERLDGIAEAALNVADGMSEADRGDFLKKSRREFIKAAEDLGMTRKAARLLATELGLLAELQPVIDVTMKVTAVRGNSGATYDQRPTQGGGRFADGGAIIGPGTPTSDSIPIMASTQEHMWSAAEVRGAGGHSQVEQLRRLARSGQLTVIGGYAEGGAIQANPAAPVFTAAPLATTSPAGGGLDLDRLATLVAGRPLFDNVTFRLQDMRDVERHARQSQQLASGGGVVF